MPVSIEWIALAILAAIIGLAAYHLAVDLPVAARGIYHAIRDCLRRPGPKR